MPRDLPAGTVTFLFTDIEGSTKLLHELGDAYADALAEHRRVLREAFERHDGVGVDTQGDAFFVAFARASDALAAAQDGQRGLADGPVRVRMGIHTGEPLVTAEGYVGADVHKGARIAAAGHGGQVLLSEQTARLVDAPELEDLGLHRLKDLTEAQRLYQLGAAAFPSLKTLNQTNLPVQPTPFVGRERELGEVLDLLRRPDVRAVTVTGPAGGGKTRLALQAAAELADDYDAVWWIPLQDVRDAALVIPTIASVLGAGEDLTRHVGDKRLLLVLDNFEHVIVAAADLAAVLAASPGLGLLVTSREPLHVAAEYEYTLPQLGDAEAAELFLDRARSRGVLLEIDDTVAAICRRLDGLPLAIELAAARAKSLTPKQILDRLDRRLDLLTSGSRDSPARQQTLRAALDWSHDLLGEEEQRLFARLGVFAGSFSLEAAEAVAAANVDELEALVDKSLLHTNVAGRFFMLESVRSYAVERLDASAGADGARRQHAEYFVEFAEETTAQPERPPDVNAQELDRANFGEAFEWLGIASEDDLRLRLAAALRNLWMSRGPTSEGERWYSLVLAGRPPEGPALVRSLTGAAWLSMRRNDFDEVEVLSREAAGVARRVGDQNGLAFALRDLATCASQRGDFDQAMALNEQARDVFRTIGDARRESNVLHNIAYTAWARGDLARAEEYLMEELQEGERLADSGARMRASLDLGQLALWQGRADEAAPYLRDALTAGHAADDIETTVYALAALAAVASATGAPQRAARLIGHAEALSEPLGDLFTHQQFELALRKRTLATLRDSLEPETLAAELQAGRKLDAQAAFEYALAEG